MNRYHNNDEQETSKRIDKNRRIYKSIKDEEIGDIDISDNVSVINADTTNLNIDDLRAMLDKKYRETNSNINLEAEEIEIDEEKEITKEYDLKKVIDEARNKRNKDYDIDRFKKLRESEYEILESLNLPKSEKVKEHVPLTVDGEEEMLKTLIETINIEELKRKEEISLMDDLMGSDNTEVLDPISDDTEATIKKPTLIEELEKTKQLSKKDIQNAMEEEKIEVEEQPLVNTFYTGNLSIKDSDLSEFDDLEKELKSNGALIKTLIALVVLIVLVVGVYFLNKYFDLGLLN